jgi:rod shape-determining protein MreC
VHDKQIRRRRAVLALLVVVSLVLLTDYFGSPSSSPLHSVQRGIVDVLSPVQDGASKVLSPVRDVAGWFSSTFKAKSQVAQLTREKNRLTGELAADQNYYAQYKVDQALLKLDDQSGLNQYDPVAANVIGKNPLLWYETITVDRGTDDGVREFDPVVGPGGLVGDVSAYLGPKWAVVQLLTSPSFSVGAEIQDTAGTSGVIQPLTGDPTSLRLNHLPTSASAQVSANQLVVTSGFSDARNPAIHSLYPAGIPIGTVSSVNPQNSVLTGQEVDVTPFVDFPDLRTVQILTKPNAG